MGLSAAASVMGPGGSILVYGANDEGIQGAVGQVRKVFSSVETLAVGGRCRVFRGESIPAEVRNGSHLRDWRIVLDLEYPDLPPDWVSYPGVFSHGRLDEGTRLLLDVLPAFSGGARILDYGCGRGVIGYVVRERGADVVVELLDVDAVALEAARENVSGAHTHLMDGLPIDNLGPFDAIVSNPPFHRGKVEEPSRIVALIQRAAPLLKRKGSLVLVSQRRLPLEGPLREHYQLVDTLAEDRTFRVWEGRNPKAAKRN